MILPILQLQTQQLWWRHKLGHI